MLDPSKKLVYAVESVVDIAYNGGSEPVRSREIAKRQGVPHRYLEQVMQRLVHAGVLRGVRGPRGGYLLARERRRITLGQIARVVRELENLDQEEGEAAASEFADQVLQPIWNELQEDMMNRLDKITIEDLCRHATGLGIKRASEMKLDYTI
ncbi:MAG: Rrf2 family transcriptional regulator [Alphaproteobacteria bacterium]|jgi:Rrf2 family protein|nr:Rrf2 family transcriptional regulator [Alphaproteobacteria bacterium]MDP6590355.1 Rrf2 family transcriptional regulator [Alphaproteobacteria bacterium]MDP6816435.1 Rrf2 family transcriptional regulator [Alphaproteobacteria bacterium]